MKHIWLLRDALILLACAFLYALVIMAFSGRG